MSLKPNNVSITLSACHFFLAVSSGWALKHHIGLYSMVAFWLLFLHSVLCIFRFTHPNANKLIRIISLQTTQCAPLLFVSLIITELLLIINAYRSLWMCTTTIISALTFIAFWRDSAFNLLFTNIWVIWNIALMAYIALLYNECYWTAGFAILVFLNHFIFWRLKERFKISRLEVTTIGLCFFVIFSLNTIDEVTEISRFSNRSMNAIPISTS